MAQAKTQSPQVRMEGDLLAVNFNRFDLDAYSLFLKVKKLPEYKVDFDREACTYAVTAPARFAPMLGVSLHKAVGRDKPISKFLLDDQRAIVRLALDAKRYACWSDCGLGKTLIGLEFIRHVLHRAGGRALIVTLNEIVPQWIEESAKFYGDALPIVRLETREQMKHWCATGCIGDEPTAARIAITNYEKFNHRIESDQVVSEIRQLSAVVLDESSRLKGGGGKQKWSLIKSCRGVEYKLSLTATPAPNELMEFASQASWLEKMRAGESIHEAAQQIIWTYFTRDSKTHRWTVKKHAQEAFFQWMSSWSVYVRDPRRYGWRKDIQPPPEPLYFHHDIAMTMAQREFVIDINADPRHTTAATAGMMFVGELNATGASKLSQAAKGFVYEKSKTDGSGRSARAVESKKPQFVADLIRAEAGKLKLQTLVWTVFDEEARILGELLQGSKFTFEILTGQTPAKERTAILERFRHGETRALISRANMLGYGMNFQFVRSMIFSGWSFSYESFYQAIRRAYRYLQRYKLRVHIPLIRELEGQMWDAIGRKQRQHEEAIAAMEANYIRALAEANLQRKERAA